MTILVAKTPQEKHFTRTIVLHDIYNALNRLGYTIKDLNYELGFMEVDIMKGGKVALPNRRP